jgi:hypothetical protein
MSPAELRWRTADHIRRITWRKRHVAPGTAFTIPANAFNVREFRATLPAGTARRVTPAARAAVVDAADQLLTGHWSFLGVARDDMADPDWFRDPLTGIRSDPTRYVFAIDHKDEAENGNAKQIWEISRLQHLTVLASAYYLTGDEQYAEAVARALQSWWFANPNLSGVNWACGIEVGIRLISWAWIRRLLADWPGIADLFEHNPSALQQIAWHQEYLAAFRSRGSSANNHVIAEAAGQLAGASAFPWFADSDRWRADAAELLELELERNTFPSGINRELAFDYQGFVAELATAGVAEATAAGYPASAATLGRIAAMMDATAAVLDTSLGAPRQGDGDDGRGLILDDPRDNRWRSLLALGAAIFTPMPWWPAVEPDVASVLISALLPPLPPLAGRRQQRTSHFADAGITVLRTAPGVEPEIWARCDAGPHGFLSIAGHAHADALSIEVRHEGVDILADPGTYCYHGEARWRSYFRSTLGHNTLELDGQDQSLAGGPFLWRRHAKTTLRDVSVDDGAPQLWAAQHDGYTALDSPATHTRRVTLDPTPGILRIEDTIEGASAHDVRLAFHLGPLVLAEVQGSCVRLAWPEGCVATVATMSLPDGLTWSAHRGESDPVLGWYSDEFGVKAPTTTLIGVGRTEAGVTRLVSSIVFPTAEMSVARGRIKAASAPS